MNRTIDQILDFIVVLTIAVCFINTILLMIGAGFQFFTDREISLTAIYSAGMSGAFGVGLSLFFIKVKRMAQASNGNE